ncbi:uncharacterized protein LOC135155833 [Lytechinus pictus]|uniref:uncharacterized protein LOC135155833 n=1 Tax=Lytechinus pictus TaxID=7653 RepID=UPI0030BA1705
MTQSAEAPAQLRSLSRYETPESFLEWKRSLMMNLCSYTDFLPFLSESISWQRKSKANTVRGFVDDSFDVAGGKTAAQKVVVLELMLGQISASCPIIARGSIVNKSTSLADIWDLVCIHFGFDRQMLANDNYQYHVSQTQSLDCCEDELSDNELRHAGREKNNVSELRCDEGSDENKHEDNVNDNEFRCNDRIRSDQNKHEVNVFRCDKNKHEDNDNELRFNEGCDENKHEDNVNDNELRCDDQGGDENKHEDNVNVFTCDERSDTDEDNDELRCDENKHEVNDNELTRNEESDENKHEDNVKDNELSFEGGISYREVDDIALLEDGRSSHDVFHYECNIGVTDVVDWSRPIHTSDTSRFGVEMDGSISFLDLGFLNLVTQYDSLDDCAANNSAVHVARRNDHGSHNDLMCNPGIPPDDDCSSEPDCFQGHELTVGLGCDPPSLDMLSGTCTLGASKDQLNFCVDVDSSVRYVGSSERDETCKDLSVIPGSTPGFQIVPTSTSIDGADRLLRSDTLFTHHSPEQCIHHSHTSARFRFTHSNDRLAVLDLAIGQTNHTSVRFACSNDRIAVLDLAIGQTNNTVTSVRFACSNDRIADLTISQASSTSVAMTTHQLRLYMLKPSSRIQLSPDNPTRAIDPGADRKFTMDCFEQSTIPDLHQDPPHSLQLEDALVSQGRPPDVHLCQHDVAHSNSFVIDVIATTVQDEEFHCPLDRHHDVSTYQPARDDASDVIPSLGTVLMGTDISAPMGRPPDVQRVRDVSTSCSSGPARDCHHTTLKMGPTTGILMASLQLAYGLSRSWFYTSAALYSPPVIQSSVSCPDIGPAIGPDIGSDIGSGMGHYAPDVTSLPSAPPYPWPVPCISVF